MEINQWWELWLLHIITESKSIRYSAYGLKISLTTTEWNLAHTWIMAMKRLELRGLRFQEGNITVLAIQTCMVKLIRSRNQRVLSSSLIITIGKISTVKDLTKLEIHKLFWKIRSMVVNGVKQRLTPIPPQKRISRIAGHICQSSCLRILRVVAGVMNQYFKRWLTIYYNEKRQEIFWWYFKRNKSLGHVQTIWTWQ